MLLSRHAVLGENIPHVPGDRLTILFQGEVPGIQEMELNGGQAPLVRVEACFGPASR